MNFINEMEKCRMWRDCGTLSTTVKRVGAGKEREKANPELLASL